jgi:hypothetical protein
MSLSNQITFNFLQSVMGEVEITTGKSCKSPGTDQIPAELIKAGDEILCSVIRRLVLYGIRRNSHSSGRNLLL